MFVASVSLILAVLPLNVFAFHVAPMRNSGFRLAGNKIDSIPIEGSLQPLSNNLLIKVKEVIVYR
jgi:hypothetical protein